MPVGKIPRHFPNTLAMLTSKCRAIWVFDYLKRCFIDDLKSVAYQRRFETTAVDCYFLGRMFRQLRLCGKRLVAINRDSGQRLGRALCVGTRQRGDSQQQSKTECFHVTCSMWQLTSNVPSVQSNRNTFHGRLHGRTSSIRHNDMAQVEWCRRK